MMICFGDATKDQIERELAQPNTTTIESISNLDKKLEKFLPSKYSDLERLLLRITLLRALPRL